jgi:hypothetical protein
MDRSIVSGAIDSVGEYLESANQTLAADSRLRRLLAEAQGRCAAV